ncbi:unnamed protein product [Urochloa humidicola]
MNGKVAGTSLHQAVASASGKAKLRTLLKASVINGQTVFLVPMLAEGTDSLMMWRTLQGWCCLLRRQFVLLGHVAGFVV